MTPIQTIILTCVQKYPGRFQRSELAKLLVGSLSSRLIDPAGHPFYGRLANYGRKQITAEIDSLCQQGYLQHGRGQRLYPTPDKQEAV